ncbi:MAG: hypothetical protein ONB44_11595 [candidate division KSB1 bacterium]|nr:hypothetical protein [candidate division KSB1 bacterium]MDZ7302768.1 hypothetical protein [candidate division KSB1 bacterium]MDZ7310067.1 hypothetical protein [candidate division KSB1 bacterium]
MVNPVYLIGGSGEVIVYDRFIPGQRLSNYRDYYFAVTSYVVDMNATPRVIESPLHAIRAAPSAPDYGVSIEAKIGTKVDLVHEKGNGDGEFFYRIVDPTVMQYATYRVTWNNDSTPYEGAYTWNLDRNGVRVLSRQPITGRDFKGNPQNNAPIVDGLQIQILPATFLIPEFIESWEQTVDINPNDNGLWLWGGSYFVDSSDLASDFYGDGSKALVQLQADLGFRFRGARISEAANDTIIVSGGQLGIIRSRRTAAARAVVRLPFEFWDIENKFQLNVFVTEHNANAKSPWGDNGVPQYYRIRGRDYITPIHTPYNETTLTKDSFDRTDSNATWVLFFEAGERGPMSQWSTGDRLVVHFFNATIPGVDEYTFTTTSAVVTGQSVLAKNQLQKVNIVPNPYWAQNPGEPSQHFVRITNLPGQGATIRIFNLAGDLVRRIDDAARRNGGTAGLQYVNWDLRNDMGARVGSGFYLIHVEVPGVGTVVKKAVVIMPEE